MPAAPTGEQIALRHGPWRAVVGEVGGGLRVLECDGEPLLEGYGPGEMAPDARGHPLLPWPNRLAGGRYLFAGEEHRLPVDDPATGSAIHGLTRWTAWTVAERSASRCALALRLHPRPGYPFALDLAIGYELEDEGLAVSLRAENAGDRPAPFGAGFHPYLTLGTGAVDDLAVAVPALGAPRLGLDGAAPLGGAALDHCLSGLRRDGDGLARVRLRAPSGRAATLWADPLWDFLMVFTGDTLAPGRRRRGLALEPMTCAPDAFNTGEGLIVLAPGESVSGRWGISAGG